MKVLVFTFLGLALMATAAQAQCGCGTPVYAPVMQTRMMPAPTYMAPPVHHSHNAHAAPATSYGPASISYVSKLANPIPRANYTLNYAIHLTDGRVLLSDFLPSGYQVQGVEDQVSSQRKMDVSLNGDNSVMVRDPQSNSPVATFRR